MIRLIATMMDTRTCSAHDRPFVWIMLTDMPCFMSIPKKALGQDVPTTFEMLTTFEHPKSLPTVFAKNPIFNQIKLAARARPLN